MGSDKFRFIRSDGSRPVMTVGGDIVTYQSCLIRFKDAWQLYNEEPQVSEPVEGQTEGQYDHLSLSILQRVKSAYCAAVGRTATTG